jgi:hypothetical protein
MATPRKSKIQNRNEGGKGKGEFLATVPELQDDMRKKVLFSPFPVKRESNPKKWDELRLFWTKIVYLCFMTFYGSLKSKAMLERIPFFYSK